MSPVERMHFGTTAMLMRVEVKDLKHCCNFLEAVYEGDSGHACSFETVSAIG